MEKKLRSLLLKSLGTESYLGLVSSAYIRLISAGFLKDKYPELFYLKECSYQEIALVTGFSLNEVKSHIQNGKRNLKNIITHKNEQAKNQ